MKGNMNTVLLVLNGGNCTHTLTQFTWEYRFSERMKGKIVRTKDSIGADNSQQLNNALHFQMQSFKGIQKNMKNECS